MDDSVNSHPENNVYLDPSDVDEVVELDDCTTNEDSNTEDENTDEYKEDNSIFTFTGHSDSVFCVRLHPGDSSVVASGGQDDAAHVWNLITGKIIFSCTGNKDSVTNVSFNHDGTLLATGDMSGFIRVWQFPTGEEIWSFEVSDLEWMKWHGSVNVLFCGTDSGSMWMWKIPSGDCKTFQGSGTPALCGVIFPDGRRAAVGHSNGDIRIWDLKSSSCIHSLTGHFSHSDAVVAIDCSADNSLLLTGSSDGTAKLCNTHSGKAVVTFDIPKGSNYSDETKGVETVSISKISSFAAVGTLSGALSIIDIGSHQVRDTSFYQNAVNKIVWHPDQTLLYFSCLDGYIRCMDAKSCSVLSTWSGHTDDILDFDISHLSGTLVSSSDDKSVKVYNLTS